MDYKEAEEVAKRIVPKLHPLDNHQCDSCNIGIIADNIMQYQEEKWSKEQQKFDERQKKSSDFLYHRLFKFMFLMFIYWEGYLGGFKAYMLAGKLLFILACAFAIIMPIFMLLTYCTAKLALKIRPAEDGKRDDAQSICDGIEEEFAKIVKFFQRCKASWS